MIWENFTPSGNVRAMAQRNTEEVIEYIAKNLRSIARLSSVIADCSSSDSMGMEPPLKLDDSLDDALRIAGGEVVLSQLTTFLAVACSEALDRGIRPTKALKMEDYAGFDAVNEDLFRTLDEFGLIYSSYVRERRELHQLIGRTQLLQPASSDKGYPLRIVWKDDGTLNDVVAGYVVALEAYEAARNSLISSISAHSTSLQGE